MIFGASVPLLDNDRREITGNEIKIGNDMQQRSPAFHGQHLNA